MWASYYSYQLVNLVLAGLLVWAYLRVWGRRWPRSQGQSPLRRLMFRQVPMFVLLSPLVALSTHLWQRTGMGLLYPWTGPKSMGFLGVAVVYYAWFVVLPLIGVVGVFGPWRTRGRAGDRWLAVGWLVLAGGVLVDSLFVEPFRVTVEEVEVALADWPAHVPPVRVVVLADLQSPCLTSRERRVAELVEELDGDLILIPGDLMGQTWDDTEAIRAARSVTERLQADGGVLAVNGDVDLLIEAGLEAAVKGTRVQVLDNESTVLDLGVRVEVLGVDPLYESAYREALSRPSRAPLRIGLVHRPRHAEELIAAGVDLVVAGHTHGGQVVVPGFGPPLTASPLHRDLARGGLHRVGEGQLYISRGIGMEAGVAPPIRFFCPPEITVLTLGPVRTEVVE